MRTPASLCLHAYSIPALIDLVIQSCGRPELSAMATDLPHRWGDAELIAAAGPMMRLECTVEELARTIHAHPTLSEAIAEAAQSQGCRSVAFTYNDPVIFLEYAVDIARECRERGVRSVAVTAGYVMPKARHEFFNWMSARPALHSGVRRILRAYAPCRRPPHC